jgi:protein involved in polysaccharide export with SLBB domain
MRLIPVLLIGLAFESLRAQSPPGAFTPQETSTPASAVASINSMELLDNRRPLGAGDSVNFRIVEDRKDPITIQITDSGEMEVPMIGRVHAAGLTCKAVAQKIKSALEKQYYNKATVILGLQSISSAPKGRVYLTGQVATQGPIDIPSKEDLTVSKAILEAGGFADFADKRRVRLHRRKPDGSTETIKIDVKRILEKGLLEEDIILMPNDYIVVPERWLNF